ncbi:PAS domain S-box protein [Dactylosporangium roseum]|uniref:histidine kinase n=1 Tax=Dactylosporangium roseum TaxID=47989 RepID=A0ABY5Z0P5_9ACTN|nr:cell wall metabolism sensor histidine kinase WalK [Dactylosporangium roseum]UWZ35591.1 PAS domain S-box protein [Dactylosporangium roseum]
MLYGDAEPRTPSAPGHRLRLLPLLSVAVLAVAVAWLPPRTGPVALGSATGLLVVLLATAVMTLRRRLPTFFEALPALGFFGVVALLDLAADGGTAGYEPLALLPVFWLALHHGRVATAIGVTMMALVFLVPVVRDAGLLRTEWRHTLLVIVLGALIAAAARSWTRRLRSVTRQADRERDFSHAVLAAATDRAVIGADRHGVVTVFNAGAERLLGYRAAEVVGVADLARFHDELDLGGLETLLAPARSGDTEPREWTYVRHDGGRLPVTLAVSAVRDEAGEVIGYLSVARDATRERRAAEATRQALARERDAADRLRELDKVRADLVATVSHELRTPLTSILGNVEVLVDGDAGTVAPAQARLLAAVERNARRLLAMIEDLLMLSRIEAGTVRINARPVQLRSVVAGALEALEAVRGRRGVRLDVELPDTPLSVHGDPDQLERVVVNLLDNALKFTPPGGSARLSADLDGEQVRLTVADTGMGIPPGEIDQVFDQFYRSTRSREHQTQGTGLGLAITKSIVERHGGRIWAGPALGEGTVVTCLLPHHR